VVDDEAQFLFSKLPLNIRNIRWWVKDEGGSFSANNPGKS
jgi:hypothetical protein